MDIVPKGKRELIIEAAEKIFSQKGFFQAKVEEIAAEAGVGKGTVYEYFASKEEVFKQMLLEVSKDIQLEILKADENSTATEKIETIVKQHLNFILKHKNMAKMMMQEHLTMSDEMFQSLKASKEEKLKALQNIVAKGIKNGEFREDISPKVTSHLIFGANLSLSGDILEGDNGMSTDELTHRVIDMILYGISAEAKV